MRFLRYALQDSGDAIEDDDTPDDSATLSSILSSNFNLSSLMQAPILALSLSQDSAATTRFNHALSHIRRHMQSFGLFGAGFGAVVPKYGGTAEIAQVACRACAVGGGVYVLGQGIKSVGQAMSDIGSTDAAAHQTVIPVVLASGDTVYTKLLTGSPDDIPELGAAVNVAAEKNRGRILHSISIASDPLSRLFPPVSEGGPRPGVAIVMSSEHAKDDPVYLQLHSEETGECPSGQCKSACSIFALFYFVMILFLNTYLHCLSIYAVLRTIL